ncbi:hypothetical protein ACGFNY_04930 [Streptomyces chartreusis]|uniref:hypothetical protein n=1 Tax=Streptomyces chartreusis TaxID=1969 RepID=UPI0037122E23
MNQPQPQRLARALIVFHAWMEGSDMWDGNALYLDLETAKTHAAYDYEGDEYGHPDDDGDEGDRDTPDFTWVEEHGSWHLLDHGSATLVQVTETTVYRPATPREIEQQDALVAAEKAARAMTPHMPLAMALEHEAAKYAVPVVVPAVSPATNNGDTTTAGGQQ